MPDYGFRSRYQRSGGSPEQKCRSSSPDVISAGWAIEWAAMPFDANARSSIWIDYFSFVPGPVPSLRGCSGAHTARCARQRQCWSGSLWVKPPLGPACGSTGGRSCLPEPIRWPVGRRAASSILIRWFRGRRGRQGCAQRKAEAAHAAQAQDQECRDHPKQDQVDRKTTGAAHPQASL